MFFEYITSGSLWGVEWWGRCRESIRYRSSWFWAWLLWPISDSVRGLWEALSCSQLRLSQSSGPKCKPSVGLAHVHDWQKIRRENHSDPFFPENDDGRVCSDGCIACTFLFGDSCPHPTPCLVWPLFSYWENRQSCAVTCLGAWPLEQLWRR